ncbi:MAG: GNAT family N-acetyltransferase [Chitinispirillaceae bacterium]|nr:GNAT family N-acetyltransferase [Chitinispirillaceae bacterium]
MTLTKVKLTIAQTIDDLPPGMTVADAARSIHSWMSPHADTLPDCERGILDALQCKPAPGGFVLCADRGGAIVGILVMLATGMSGYVPPNLLLFLAVSTAYRRRGIGTILAQRALDVAKGPVKLHVEPDNPARFLYQKLGFQNLYIDMRLHRQDRI